MGDIDLDALRAARREAKKESPTISLGGRSWTLPVEMPFVLAAAMADISDAQEAEDTTGITRSLIEVLKALLGAQFEDFMARVQPSMGDVVSIMDGIAKVYGFADEGPKASTASSASSKKGSRPSKPNLKVATK